MSPKVSVIIAARNCERYVAEALDSILSQTFEDWEILIADDGSTDRTKEIIDRYDDPRIRRFHNESHLGLVGTWNKLLKQAEGEYITWQDADDASMPTRLERLVEALDTNPEIALCGSGAVRFYRFSGERRVFRYPLTHEAIWCAIDKRNRFPILGSASIMRRDILKHIEGFRVFFEGIGGEDQDFILRIAEKYCVANIPDALYVYRYTRGSNSRRAANRNTFLKLYIQQVVYFLADQRKKEHGLDGLMEGGDKEGLERFIENLRREFEKDPSIAYRRACLNKIDNQDYIFALIDVLRAVKTNPVIMKNYLLFPRAIGSLVKMVFRTMGRRLRTTPRHYQYSDL